MLPEQSNDKEIYDYIIIGAGPAGCFCAVRLKQAGKSVLILEKNGIGDGKVCGDGISMKCVNLLRSLNFPLERFEEVGATPIHKRIIIRDGKRKVTRFGITDDSVSYGIPRAKTDGIFRGYAQENGVKIIYHTEADKICRAKKIFSVGGCFARRVIIACGAFGKIAVKGKDIKFNTNDMAVGISATISCKLETEPCFLFDYDAVYNGQYAWIFKTDCDNWNVGLWLRQDKHKLKAYFYDFINTKLPEYLGAEFKMQSPPKGALMAIKADGIKCNPVTKPRARGVYYIGDVNMTSDELNGEGITQAIMSGVRLARRLTKQEKSNV